MENGTVLFQALIFWLEDHTDYAQCSVVQALCSGITPAWVPKIIWGIGDQTRLSCLQAKYPIHGSISPAPPTELLSCPAGLPRGMCAVPACRPLIPRECSSCCRSTENLSPMLSHCPLDCCFLITQVLPLMGTGEGWFSLSPEGWREKPW